MSLPTSVDERNGDVDYFPEPIDAQVAKAYQPPNKGIRRQRYLKAAEEMADWPSDYHGKTRMEALRHIVQRVRNELFVDEADVACLIARNLRMHGKPPYTLQELREAVLGFARRTSADQVREMSAPERAAEILPPSFTQQAEARRREEKKEADELVGIMGSDVTEKRVEWFVPNLIPRGYYTMVAGRQGVGKSTFFTGMAVKAKRVIWLCAEEQLDNVALPRLKAHGIAPSSVEFFTLEHRLSFPHCKDALARKAQKTGTDLIIVDPLTAFLGSGVDCNINEQMLPVLQGLDEIAQRAKCAFLCCLHPGKAANNTIRGASVFMTHPRVVLELVRDPGPPPKRMMTMPKNNLCGEQPAREFLAVKNAAGIGIFTFGQAVDEEEARYASEVPDRMERLVIQECSGWLAELLKDGPRARKQIMSQAKDEGFSTRTVERASDRLKVIRERGNPRAGEGSTWKLPGTDEAPTPFDTPPSEGVGG